MKKERINLEELERKSVFHAPENYFDELPSTIQKRIQAENAAASWFPVWAKLGVSLASVVLLVMAGFWLSKTYYSANQPVVNVADISGQEIIEYLQQSNVSQEELVDVAVKEKLELGNSLLHGAEEQSILEEIGEYSADEAI
jgi:hypothetical protein